MLPDLFILMLVVADVVCGYGYEVLCDIVGDVGASPDKLSGFGSILSAMAAGIPEVKPHENGLISFLTINKSIKNSSSPVEALENCIVALECCVDFDTLK